MSDLLAIASAAAAKFGLDKSLFFGLIQQESAWKTDAISGAGAVGLAQVMPWWAKTVAGRALTGLRTLADLYEPRKNLEAGAAILRDELRRFGSADLALFAYNAGATAVLNAIEKANSYDPDEVARFLPRETREYRQKVKAKAEQWRVRLLSDAPEIPDAPDDFEQGAGSVSMLLVLGAALAFTWGVRKVFF